MFHKSFSFLNKTNLINSLNKSTKLTKSFNHPFNCQSIKSFSKCSTNFNLISKNDQINDFSTYEHLKEEKSTLELTNLQLSNSELSNSELSNDEEDKQLISFVNKDYVDLDPNSKRMERDYIRTIQPQLQPTFNLATYADHLDIIRHLVKLDIKIYKIEENRELTKFLLTLDFEKDVVPYLNFLIRCGLKRQDLGDFLTRNFRILQENLINLDKRIAYYRKMKFTKKEILIMMLDYPQFINYSIDYVDAKLAYIQRDLKLKPIFVRKMLYSCPKILRTDKSHLELKKFVLIEQCGFEKYQMKHILINSSKILLRENCRVSGSFEYIYKNITQDMNLICTFSDILCTHLKILEERDVYLKKLGRNQYDPNKPLYVPLYAFLITEEEFIKQFCKTNIEDFYRYLKTL